MAGPVVIQLIVQFSVYALLIGLPAAALVRHFGKPLSYSKSYLIAVVAIAASLIFYFLYYIAKHDFGLPQQADGIATLFAMALFGYLVTRLASNYGVAKIGWLGVGAKTVLGLLALSWALVVVGFVIWTLSK